MVSLENFLENNARSILFGCVAGSRAYGTVTSSSDEDIRGVFAVPSAGYLSLARPADQVSDERGNTVYYSVRRIIELLAQANPNIIELLFMPTDCVLSSSPEMELLLSKRHIFISKQCADTHAGYGAAATFFAAARQFFPASLKLICTRVTTFSSHYAYVLLYEEA